jgi:hypothetical protein
VTRENLAEASAVERWAFFLKYAESLSRNEIEDLFTEPEFTEAAGVLEMINQTPEQLEQYSARLKLRLDEAARLEYARNEGEEKGRREGRKQGLIQLIQTLQQLLDLPASTNDDLMKGDDQQLNQLSEELQQQLRSRQR